MPRDELGTRRALVVTALAVEFGAIRSRLRNVQEAIHTQGTICEIGQFTEESGCVWSVCIAEAGAGNATAAVETERAINYFRPDVVLFVGIAGGLKDVSIGDVIAATKIHGYESGKAALDFLPRPDSYRSSYDLLQRARAEARRENWLTQVGALAKRDFKVLVAPIASGEKVIASQTSALSGFIREHYSDAVAVEMEGLFNRVFEASQILVGTKLGTAKIMPAERAPHGGQNLRSNT